MKGVPKIFKRLSMRPPPRTQDESNGAAPEKHQGSEPTVPCVPETNGETNGEVGVYPPNWVPIKEEPVYTRRPLKIIAIGAGFSGLTLAHKIQHEHKLEDVLDLVIYEKNADVGGTWFEVSFSYGKSTHTGI
jgi:hypothetical protein